MITRRGLLSLFSFAPIAYTYKLVNPANYNYGGIRHTHNLTEVSLISTYDLAPVFDNGDINTPIHPKHMMSLVVVDGQNREYVCEMEVVSKKWSVRTKDGDVS